jgi:uncharacterized membrane protein YkvA (DUF1232 family)
VRTNPTETWKQKARRLKAETYALYLAAKDPRVPWHAKIFAACVVAYALSPIDLIPDFIPVLGYLDDLVLVPLGIALTLKMIPPAVLAECRQRAETTIAQNKPTSWVAAGVIVVIWILLAAVVIVLMARSFNVSDQNSV